MLYTLVWDELDCLTARSGELCALLEKVLGQVEPDTTLCTRFFHTDEFTPVVAAELGYVFAFQSDG